MTVEIHFLIIGSIFAGCNADQTIRKERRSNVTNPVVEEAYKNRPLYSQTREVAPFIPDIGYYEAIEKLKQLWETQRQFLQDIEQVSFEIRRKTGCVIRQIGWIFNDTEALVQRQINVLSKILLENTDLDELKHAVNSDFINQQRRSWKAMEKCINDHYEFEKTDEHEERFRKILKFAENDLSARLQAIEQMVTNRQHNETTDDSRKSRI